MFYFIKPFKISNFSFLQSGPESGKEMDLELARIAVMKGDSKALLELLDGKYLYASFTFIGTVPTLIKCSTGKQECFTYTIVFYVCLSGFTITQDRVDVE